MDPSKIRNYTLLEWKKQIKWHYEVNIKTTLILIIYRVFLLFQGFDNFFTKNWDRLSTVPEKTNYML